MRITINSGFLVATLFVASLFNASITYAANLNCSTAYQIKQTFANGARWEMCWELNDREGIILNDIYYSDVDGVERKVLDQGAISQIHVPYDDNGARFHDVSDYGLGTSENLNNLQAVDCPNGQRLREGSKNVICKTFSDEIHGSVTETESTKRQVLSVFSVSHVGEYNYIPDWRFLDDGSIEPTMGATGRLQRYTSNANTGWLVRTGSTSYGVSHTHNYYWKLDFGLGGTSNNDVFEEINFVPNANSTQFTKQVTAFTSETARSMNSEQKRFWRVKDNDLTNQDGKNISYEIVAVDTGHRDVGPSNEPWTFNDVYVTRYKACERFISRNPRDFSGGCGSNEDVTDFVNGQSLVNNDLVVWFGLTFHHIPRDEDEAFMHAHWNHFKIRPRDWTAGTEKINEQPVLNNIANQLNPTATFLTLPLSASDPEGDTLSYSATGLPAGLSINSSTGQISGTPTTPGNYSVTVTVSDGNGGDDSKSFAWSIFSQNTAPAFDAIDDQVDIVNQFVSFDLQASDPENDDLSFSATSLPTGLSIDEDTGEINGTPTALGVFDVTVTVSDGSLSDVESFEWRINTLLNRAPVFDFIPSQEHYRGNDVQWALPVTDPDGDSLTFTVQNLPYGLSLDSQTGIISGRLTGTGAPKVTITVNDGRGGLDTAVFYWRIKWPQTECVECMSFSQGRGEGFSSYTDNEDVDTQIDIVNFNGSKGVSITGNRAVRYSTLHTITPSTVLEFEFQSSQESEVNGIGFDSDNTLSLDRFFQVWGTENFGIQLETKYSNGGGRSAYQKFSIPIGTYFTGTNMRLILINDNDASSSNGFGAFKNIQLID